MSGCFGRWRGTKKNGRCEEREGRQQGRSIARETRGLRRPSLDARSLAQPCCLPKENHRPPEGESGIKTLKNSLTVKTQRARLGRRQNQERSGGCGMMRKRLRGNVLPGGVPLNKMMPVLT